MSKFIDAPCNLAIVHNNIKTGKSVIPGMIICKYMVGTGKKSIVKVIISDFYGECEKVFFKTSVYNETGLVIILNKLIQSINHVWTMINENS